MTSRIETPSTEATPTGTCGETDFGRSRTIHARLWRLAEQRCIPLGASFEITLQCNLRCIHCYNFDRSEPHPKSQTGAELTPVEVNDIIDQLAKAGCLYLSFTGGEALMHPNLDDFIRHARVRRFAVKVKSNGMLLTRERVRQLVGAGASAVDVSLYGATQETHDGFTCHPGSFAKTIAGIDNARDDGLGVHVSMCLVRSNAGEIGQMIELVERLGVSCGISPFITARYDGTTSSLDERVDRATLAALYRGPLRRFLTEPDFGPNRSVQCACARATCGISASGDVYPCIGAPIPSGNLRQKRFSEIWQDSPELNRIRALSLDDFDTCAPCSDRPFCKRSSGVVYTNTGDYTGPEEFTCMDASVGHEIHLHPDGLETTGGT